MGNVTLKNRIIFAPTTLGLKKEEYFKKIQEIARGGSAMIIIGDVPVSKKGHLSLHQKAGFNYYKELADLVHKENCLLSAQLHKSDSNFKGMIKYIPGILTKKITPNDLRKLLNDQVKVLINELPTSKVKEITSSFGDAAKLAVKAGFDMIQIHGDRMCGSFSSTVFNQRTDEYGGSIENRARFAIESIEAVHEAVPTVPIDYKLAIRQENPHYGNAGVLLEECSTFVPLLEKAGVTSFHIALANHSELSDCIPPYNHPYFNQEGCFLPYVDEVRKYTKLPCAAVGGLVHPEFIEKSISEDRFELAAMSRQLIADPNWVNKVINNQADQIHTCVRCNKKCLGGMQEHKGVHCIYEKEN
ncbi:2,4-dienoyl-CoA reductase [Anaerorhabdus furcosa]|uniref:2,4-dienoyl-CoA reductase n=1 Tax=Anaerorhabdus furcosa TaxID=118967 RepID=A0A1T4LA80_9FIRM|nr:2,4-dienoyl-CoA reductase [Anaerorhabdus furcosa]